MLGNGSKKVQSNFSDILCLSIHCQQKVKGSTPQLSPIFSALLKPQKKILLSAKSVINPKGCGGGVKLALWSGDRLPFPTETT